MDGRVRSESAFGWPFSFFCHGVTEKTLEPAKNKEQGRKISPSSWVSPCLRGTKT